MIQPRFQGDDVLARLREMRGDGLRVHMIGIGGAGMCGAAVVLSELGAVVTGSDRDESAVLEMMRRRGIDAHAGHDASNLPARVHLVVISAAIPERNPELAEARRRGLPVLKYAELLGEMMTGLDGIAVAGTHGKSTTTAMTAHVLREAGLHPSFVFGATSPQLGGNGGLGSGRHFVVEACEFDRSFHRFSPRSAAILNIESDHFDCYSSLDDLVAGFSGFARRVPAAGLLVINGDDPRCRLVAGSLPCRVQTFGFSDGVDWQARGLRYERGSCIFDVARGGEIVLTTRLAIPGRHNVSNSLAAIALAVEAGVDPAAIAAALPTYEGVDRRMTLRGTPRGITVIDDYAHHPTEIRVTIEAAQGRYTPKRTVVIFQPHQHSRTVHLMDDFAASFGQADEVIVPNVYAARESTGCGIAPSDENSQTLVSRISKLGGRARYIPSLEAVTDELVNILTEGDMVLTLGAGDVWKVADGLLARIRESN